MDRIFSNLRQNFMSELSGATQPAKSGNCSSQEPASRSSQFNTNFPPASGRSKISREESFNTMLDVSCLLEEDDENSHAGRKPVSAKTTNSSMSVFQNSEVLRTPSSSPGFSEGHALLVRPIVADSNADEESRFRFKRPRKKIEESSRNGATTSTEFRKSAQTESTISTDSESRYRLKRPNLKGINPPQKTVFNPMLISQSSDLSFDTSFDTEALALREEPPSMAFVPPPKQKPSLSEQTLNKIRGFAFDRSINEDAPPRPNISEEKERKQRDDSAYESQQTATSSAHGSGKPWQRNVKLPELSHVATLGGPVDVDAELALLDSVDF